MNGKPRAKLDWRKSTASVLGNCVEVAWHKKSRSVYVRDSKAPAGPCLNFTRSEWVAFLMGVALGEFSIPALRQRAKAGAI
jgi:hypothetical protein